MANNINSLYELIKQKSQEKGRPLKIVCDWDECLQPFNALVLYKTVKENEPRDFATYFRDFHENKEVEMDYSDNLAFAKYKGEFRDQRLKKLQSETNGTEKISQEFKKHKNKDEFYEESPFLTFSEDLLKALKRNLISQLVLVTASNGNPGGRKRRKFQKTFAKFPNTELSIQKPGRFKRGEYRWQWIQNNHPDFDIFVDDNSAIISQAQENLPLEKIFVMPNYKTNRHVQGENIYHVEVNPTDLNNQHFALAALEKNLATLEKKNMEITTK
jgi:hypothetical protein